MENHPIENLMRSTLENIQQMVDVNTIVGDAIESSDGSTILPVSKVSFGFVSGGSELNFKTNGEGSKNYPFGGGSGAGVTIKPVAFLVIKNDNVKILPVDGDNTYDRIINSIPNIMESLKSFSKEKKNKNKKEE